jgi:hypothetical protein
MVRFTGAEPVVFAALLLASIHLEPLIPTDYKDVPMSIPKHPCNPAGRRVYIGIRRSVCLCVLQINLVPHLVGRAS